MKKILMGIIVIAVATIAGVFGRDFAEKFTVEPSADSIGQIAANAANEKAPVLVDKDTRMDHAVYLDRTIRYSYTLLNAEQDKKINYSHTFHDFKEKVKNKLCTTPELTITRDHGISHAYAYYDKNGVFLYKFKISPTDCNDSSIVKENLKNSKNSEWKEGQEILIKKRTQVIAACIEGITGQGFSNKQANDFCKCSVDYFTKISKKYNKDELMKIGKERGDMNFVRTDSQEQCKHLLGY
jgi:hypothetical protein